MKKILVTGANGQLGRAVNKELAGKTDYELVNTDVVDMDGIIKTDITDIDEIMRLFREVKPYAVLNCAAYTAVDKQEEDVDLSYKINAIGPRNLAVASRECGARLIHISTDYVFPGDAKEPYKEFDATGPKSIYGKSKLAGENFVREMAERYFIIRTAWLYGDGKNFVKTMLKLSENHDSVSVVDDQLGNPTSTIELAKAVASLMESDNYGLFHGTCQGITSWADFTEEIFKQAGKNTKVFHVSTKEYQQKNPQAAPRPAYSALENYMFSLTGGYEFADWRDALKVYLETMV
ncbi:MAG: dTDP-4-dehydrorhamnose reductase [Lachnospiraceae bacterium]|nr:dTDP-4-dehydrorhamnose reductase [Lachnospiraceae bacterium]